MPNQGSASYEEVDDLAHVFRFGYDDLDLADLRILEHLRKRNVLAQLGLEVQPVALEVISSIVPLQLFSTSKNFLGSLIFLTFIKNYLHSFLGRSR